MKIGICGTGRMGSAVAERLMELGHDITVWNRTKEKQQPLVDQGARTAPNPAGLIGDVEAVIALLIDDAALFDVYQGSDGLLSAELDGKLMIEMSTVLPETNRVLGKAITDKGAAFIECPVGGTIGPARKGQLFGVAGGSAEDFARAKPILDQVCRRVEHVGPLGSGAAMKLALNLPLLVYWESVGEALSIAEAAGIDRHLASDILTDTSGTIKVAPMRLPWIVEALEGSLREEAGFTVAGMAKDLRLMTEYAQAQGFEAPAAMAARLSYEGASDEGWGARDGALTAAWRALKSRNS